MKNFLPGNIWLSSD